MIKRKRREEKEIGIIAISFLLVILVGFLIFTKSYKKELFKKQEYFYSSACFLLEKCHFHRFFSDKQKKRIYDIFIGEDFKMAVLKYQCQRISYGIYGSLLVLCLLLLFSINTLTEQEREETKKIMRPLYGEGEKEISEDITLKAVKENESDERQVLNFKVKEKQYTKKEWDLVLKKVEKNLEGFILAENVSIEEVRKPLKLLERYPNTSIKIKWKTDGEIVKTDGTLKNTWTDETLPKDGVLTELIAVISSSGFQAEYSFFLKVLPEEYTAMERAWQGLKTIISKQEERTRKKEFFELPKEIGDYQVIINKEKNSMFPMVCLGITFIILFTIVPVGKIKEEEKKREKQLMEDYPKIVNKFVLLINAGLTIRGVFERLVQEYRRNKKKSKEKRYVYEEMAAVVRAIENGASEIDAMELFGKRTKLMPYLKFTSLLIQNSKKGSGDLLLLLENESVLAMEQNKERIRVMGEEAGTKLLFPMLIMLCIVFAIIMIPAFMSF